MRLFERVQTLGQLRETGYRPRSVKHELRDNLLRRLRDGEPVFGGLVGYENTVVPQLIHGILARHDLLLLGLRGQAKTRILRALPELLDEWMPVVAGVEIWDDPLHPMLAATRRAIERDGDDTPVRWVHRSERYHEKLATPDVTIADLIGEVDLVRHAEGRRLSDEETMHFGLVPRSNRGIFAINELPDLAPRIQVGLFNVLEERDVQIRGYPVRLSLDVVLVFSANPEDYTNRGRIVTPLKDRIGAVIRTHYPFDNDVAMRITRENAEIERSDGPPVTVPPFIHEIIEETVRLARVSPHVNQQSGVSVRTSIAALEAVVASAERRAVACREPAIVPRVSDLEAMRAACRGKIELLLSEDEHAEDKLIDALIGEALRNTFDQYVDDLESLQPIVNAFLGGKLNLEVGDDLPAATVLDAARSVRGLLPAAEGVVASAVDRAARRSAPHSPATEPRDLWLAAGVEFVLEGLHVHDKLSRYTFRQRTFYKQ